MPPIATTSPLTPSSTIKGVWRSWTRRAKTAKPTTSAVARWTPTSSHRGFHFRTQLSLVPIPDPYSSESREQRHETPLERLDRNLEELTGELRVVVTGVQVLFAFLLIVPFNSGFVGVGPFVRGIYFATLLCSALAALCTLAPAASHRLLFRADDKRHVVFLANRLSIAGLVFLALAMCGSLLLVTTKLFGATPGVVTA